MFTFVNTAVIYLFLVPLCNCVFVEISLNDKNETKTLKLVCGQAADNFHPKGKHIILWKGSQFGNDERQKLAEALQSDDPMPNLLINSSKRHRCYLLAPVNLDADSLIPQKKRVSRNSAASIPSEDGTCPPGHRIDQDQCFPCFPGSYTSGQDTKCFLCPMDFFVSKEAADSCWPCPDGRKTLAQGADSEEACVYIDESGHADITQNPPWVLIFTAIGIIITCVWIIFIIILVRYWSEGQPDEADQVERAENRADPNSKSRRSFLRRKTIDQKDMVYDDISYHSDPEDHIYEEIEDENDMYEVPRKSSDPREYLDLDAPKPPPKRSRSIVEERKGVDNDSYEIPIQVQRKYAKTSSESQYEVPIKKSTDDHIYEVPKKKSSADHLYEVPRKKSSDDHRYEIPRKKSLDDILYETPRKKSSDDRLYETSRKENFEDNLYEVPIDDEQNMNQNNRSSRSQMATNRKDDDRRLSNTRSTGFEPSAESISTRKATRGSEWSNMFKTHSGSSEEQMQTQSNMSNERITVIPEESEDMYSIPKDSNESF